MIQIIPAIDVMGGKCVRLSQGDYNSRKIYSNEPLELARQFEAAGIKRLHIVDLDGARQGRLINLPVLNAIASGTDLLIDYGGGIKTEADVTSIFNAGAAMVSIGSMAVRQPERVLNWAALYGADKIFIGADVRNRNITIDGWQKDSCIDILTFAGRLYKHGLRNIFCTDVAKDGMLQGVALDLYKEILLAYPDLQLTASGGVAGMEDIDALSLAGCKAVIVGKALYEGKITLPELKKYGG